MTRSHAIALAVFAGLAAGMPSIARAQSAHPDAAPDRPVARPGQPDAPAASKPAGPTKIDRYAKVLTLDKAQTAAARSLYDAYQSETRAAAKKIRESMKDAQDDMNSGDRAGFEKRIQATMAEHSAAAKKLTDQFLDDLKSLLTPRQLDRWPSLERFRRREQFLSGMMTIGNVGGIAPGGSAVDLFPIIDKLGLPADLRARADEQLAMYEVDIDRPLRERQQNTEDEQKQMGAVQHFDGDSFQKKLERDRKVDMAIREVNSKYVRQIAALLPDDLAKKLAEAYDARAYRTIYKDSTVSKKLAAALQAKDLSADQRAKLQSLLDQYKRDARAANDRWADAQKKAEDAGRPTGGGLLVMGPGDTGAEKIDPDFAAARAARRDIDNAARDQLDKLLTPEQLADLSKPNQGQGGTGGGGGARRVAVFGDGTGEDMVLVDDFDLPDDAEPGAGGGGPVFIMRTVESGSHGPGEGGGGTPGGGNQPRPSSKP